MQRCTKAGLSSIFRITASTTAVGATKRKKKENDW